MTKRSPNTAVTVVGTGWPKDTLTEPSTITRQLIDEVAVPLARSEGAPLIFVGGVGKNKQGEGFTEAERARHYLAENSVVERDVEGFDAPETASGVVASTRKKVGSLIDMYTDCDPDFIEAGGRPSRSTIENGENLALIVRRLIEEGRAIESVHVVAPTIQVERAINAFRKAFDELDLGNVELIEEGVPIEFEPGNAQTHWQSENKRRVWEAISRVYEFFGKLVGEERLRGLKEKLKKLAGQT